MKKKAAHAGMKARNRENTIPGKSWQARIGASEDRVAENFVESLSFDKRLAEYDIRGSLVHADMLAKVGLIHRTELERIRSGLNSILDDIRAGRFKWDIRQEDIHMAIESALVERIGDPGRKLHTGRSRNDQVALDLRLWCLDAAAALHRAIIDLQQAFLTLAEGASEIPAPSYTHLQRAQPIVFAHELLAYVEMLDRDRLRLLDVRRRTSISPLGAGAAAGSTLPIDRAYSARELGFTGVTRNSLDSVSDRDFAVELVFAMSMVAMHLSRFAEQWIIYSSTEFQFIRLADTHTTGSSMMPQKRNPDMLELIRGKTGGIYGQLIALLAMFKGLPMGYNRDMQEDKRLVFSAFDAILPCIEMAAAMVRGVSINSAVISSRIDEGFPDATVLAEYLVNKGIPFRTAHQVVGKLVARCEDTGITTLSKLPLDDMRRQCPVIGPDVFKSLGSANVLRAYRSTGSGGIKSVSTQIAWWRRAIKRAAVELSEPEHR
jgi:argininosuccinate lyase